MQQINEAYAVLSNPWKRAQYDYSRQYGLDADLDASGYDDPWAKADWSTHNSVYWADNPDSGRERPLAWKSAKTLVQRLGMGVTLLAAALLLWSAAAVRVDLSLLISGAWFFLIIIINLILQQIDRF